MQNKMTDLRNHLFETIESLKDTEKPMDLARARAISEVAQTIIDTAKVEIDMLKVVNADTGSEFFDQPQNLERRRLAAAAAGGPRAIGR